VVIDNNVDILVTEQLNCKCSTFNIIETCGNHFLCRLLYCTISAVKWDLDP